jgi:hypothetical protein
MTLYQATITLPRTIEITVCASDERTAWQGAEEFVATAFANALRFWDDNEPICDDAGNLLGEVRLEMPHEGMIELAAGAVELQMPTEWRQ